MIKNEIDYLIKIMNDEEINIEYIKDNYEDILIFVNRIIKEQSPLYSDKCFSNLLDKIIKIIFDRLINTNEITYIESEILLYSLYYETFNSLNLEKMKIIEMKFLNPSEKKIIKNKKGVFTIEEYPKSGIIYYNKKNIEIMCKKSTPIIKKIDTMIAICHELIHAKQIEDISKGKLDLTTYIIALEELTNIVTKSEYYKKNYKKTLIELDATLKAKYYIYEFFYRHGLFNEEKLEIISNILTNKDTEIIDICNETEFEFLNLCIRNNKTKYNLTNIASIYIRRNEGILDIFKNLNIFYRSDGILKSPIEILKEKEKNKNNDKLNQMYKYIFEYIMYYFRENIDINGLVLEEVINTINYLTKKQNLDELEQELLINLKSLLCYPTEQISKEQQKIKVKKI